MFQVLNRHMWVAATELDRCPFRYSSSPSERTGTLGDNESSVKGEGKGFLTG